jgi:hypothetical protein
MLRLNIKNMAKMTNKAVWLISHLYCKVWYWGRCTLRNKNDFDYFISNLRTENSPLKFQTFFQKKITLNDDREKSVAVRVSDIQIEYSFTKKKKKDNLVHLFGYDAMEEVIKALVQMTKTAHHNASVISLAKRRKEKGDGIKYRKSNS